MLRQVIEPEKITEFKLWLPQVHTVVIVCHVSPDGDALGSSLGLSHFLRSIGKKAFVIVPNSFPAFLKWMPGSKEVKRYDIDKSYADKIISEAQMICCLDFNAVKRIEGLGELVSASKAKKIMIDHHPHPEEFCDITISVPEACSTSELVFRFILGMGMFRRISIEGAQCLYAGMMTDTGGFTYNSNDPEIYGIISMLLSKGIDKDQIYRNVFHTYSASRLKLQGYLLENMKMYEDCHASLMTLTKEEQGQFNFMKGDSEGFVNIPLCIKDVKLSCFLREDTERAIIKVSLRSEGDFSCTLMAEQFFSGGGHFNASGGEVAGTMQQAIEKWEEALAYFKPMLSADEKNTGKTLKDGQNKNNEK